MKRKLEFVLAGLLVAAVATGCPKNSEGDGNETSATTETATSEEAETTAETTESETTEDADAGAMAAVEEPMYIKAAYEVTCVKTKVEDPEEQTAILAEIYPRYGFETAEAFGEAEKAMADKESVKLAVEEKMKNCTVELAKGFKEAGATEEEGAAAKDEDKKPAKPKLSYKPGSYSGSVGGGGITGGKFKLVARDDGQATGVFSGKREGKNFVIALKGSISNNGEFRLRGSKGKNDASAKGTLKGDKANGSVKGSINQQAYTVSYTLN